MYKYRHTSSTRAAVSRLHELRTQLDRRGPLPRVWLGRTRRDLEAEAIAASTSMEGVAVTADEVRRILVGDRPKEVSPENRQLVLGYQSAMEYVLRRADDAGFTWQTELILGLHDRVLAGSYALGAGRFRDTQNRVTRTADGAVVYLPPQPSDVPGAVNEMCKWAQQHEDLEPPIMAACLHVRLAGIHPFADGNGRTARVLASLAMYRGGFRLPEFTSLEEWWGRHVSDYYQAFSCLGEQWNPSVDITQFIEIHMQAQVRQVEALSLRQETERALWIVFEDMVSEDLEMDRRAANALYDAFHVRPVTNEYYRQLTDVSVNTATADLKRLAASGMLKGVGYGRARMYQAERRLYEAVVEAAELARSVQIDSTLPLERLRHLVVAALAGKIRVN